MRFWAQTAFSPPSHYIPLAKAADEAGIDGILMSDHIFFPRPLQSPYPYSPYEDRRPVWDAETPWPDVWVTVGAMAAVTTRIQFGSSIYIAPARDLFTVAKQVGTAAVLSGNRVHLGVGVGWMKEEFDQTGQPFAHRGQRLDEMIEALRVLWAGGWVEHHGEHYDFGPLQIEPAPTRPVPIWCGGHSEPAMRRAARLADGWVGNAYSEDDAERYVGRMRTLLSEAGRGDESFEIIIGLYVPPTADVVARWEAKGVTGLLCVPWFLTERDDDRDVAEAQGSASLDRKIIALHRFAEIVQR